MLTGREGRTVKKSDTKVSDFWGFLVKRLQKVGHENRLLTYLAGFALP